MKVNPFFFGVLCTITIEAVALILAAVTTKRNK